MSAEQTPAPNVVTQLLERIETGDGGAAAELFPIVYDELRCLARRKLRNERVENTLQATALVNEAYLRIVGPDQDLAFDSRKGFFIAAAEAMRHILVDAARRKLAQKRGGRATREMLDVDRIVVNCPEELVHVHEALEAFARHDLAGSELVKLHYCAGYSLAEAAELLNISRSTANRWWLYAKAWLKDKIEQDERLAVDR